jgi:Flp pilus assembly CpaE family ATPase
VYTEASNDGKMLSDLKSAAAAYEGLTYLAHRLQTGEFPAQITGKKGKKLSLGRKKPAKKDAGSSDGKTKKSLFAKLKKRK